MVFLSSYSFARNHLRHLQHRYDSRSNAQKLLIFHFPFSCNLTLAKWRHKFSIDFLPLSQFNTIFFFRTRIARFIILIFFFCASPTTVALVRRLDFLASYNRGRYTVEFVCSLQHDIYRRCFVTKNEAYFSRLSSYTTVAMFSYFVPVLMLLYVVT